MLDLQKFVAPEGAESEESCQKVAQATSLFEP